MTTARGLTVTGVTVTPVAIQDPPLLAASGVHPPYALRSIIEVHTDAGLTASPRPTATSRDSASSREWLPDSSGWTSSTSMV